jgi:hypothetical protein
VPVFHSSSGTSTSSDTERIASALGHLRHTIERYLTHPDLARDGLPLLLNTADARITNALKDLDRQADADLLARDLTRTRELGTAQSGPAVCRDSLTALLGTIDRLLILICLPLKNESIESLPIVTCKKPKRMMLKEAESKVRVHLKQCPHSTREQVARNVGCSPATVSNTNAWKRTVNRRQVVRIQRKKVGLEHALNRKAVSDHQDLLLEELVEQQDRDDRSHHALIE